MPRDLPGLFWDDLKHRYFPLPRPRPPAPTQPDPAPNRTPNTLRALSDLRAVLSTARRDALIHQIQSSLFSLTDCISRSPVPSEGPISAFCTTRHGATVWRIAGDTTGWLYSSHRDVMTTDAWQRQFHLSSEVSSISVSGSACIATSFGPQCQVLYIPLESPVEGIHITSIDSHIAHDIWTADLQGSRLALGANKQALVIEDISLGPSLRRLPTGSDVLALAQRQHNIYTGLRNGSILQFDNRVQRPSGHPLFTQRTTPVTALQHLRDYRLLAAFLDGQISAFDLRFPISDPLVTFTGNVNSYTLKLPLVTDPHEKLLFAAGQDNKIRLWSLVTGGPALESGGTNQTAFQHAFEHRVAALQVVEENDGPCLWAASGKELCKYTLGHRSGIEISAGAP